MRGAADVGFIRAPDFGAPRDLQQINKRERELNLRVCRMGLQTLQFMAEFLECTRCKYLCVTPVIIVAPSGTRHVSLSPWATSLAIQLNLQAHAM